MKVATWNVFRGDIAQKTAHLDRYSPDVTVLQECSRPATDSDDVLWLGDAPIQGIGIVGSDRYRVEAEAVREEAGTHVLPVSVSGSDSFHILGVWTRKDPTYVRALMKGLDEYREFILDAPTVVLGDFNSSPAFTWEPRNANNAALVEKLANEFGLVSAYHSFFNEDFGAESRPTLYHQRKESQPFHIDYCFVPEAWAERITGVEVGTFEEFEGLSDHRPLVVEVGG